MMFIASIDDYALAIFQKNRAPHKADQPWAETTPKFSQFLPWDNG
jgi:hypothetical protein